jgi:hypothetical protein
MATAARPQLDYLHAALEDLKAKHLYTHLRVLDGEQKPVCMVDGKEVINLASNNYLGLTTHPKMRRAAIEAVRKYGVGSGAVRSIAGTMKIHMELEEQIARFKNTEACVVFQSGFAANAVKSCDQGFQAQGSERLRTRPERNGKLEREEAASDRRGLLDGWRYRRSARALHAR